MNTDLTLSICLVTYNAEKFVSQAIDSILMQNINFNYEIIVADDYSTDNTLLIILDYKKLYPKLIRILDSTSNLGITKNYKRVFQECSGKYIAVLEGDDYWISPNKISEQIKFLEQNPDCSFCSHKMYVHNEMNNTVTIQSLKNQKKSNTKDLILDNFIGNFSTCMYRNEIVRKIPTELYDLIVYDWMFNIVNSTYGSIGYVLKPLSVYRVHKDGLWSSSDEIRRNKDTISTIGKYNLFLEKKFESEFNDIKSRLIVPVFIDEQLSHKMKSHKIRNILFYLLPPILVILLKKLKRLIKCKV